MKRKNKLARRYGHFSIEKTTDSLIKWYKDHPKTAGAVVGGSIGVIGAELGVNGGAVVGAGLGLALGTLTNGK